MLAQDWLYGDRVKTKHDAYVERFLRLPTELGKHQSLAILNSLAERIVFTDDVPTLLYDMHDNKQLTFDGVLSSAKLPYDCFWLEYNTTVGLGIPADNGGIESTSYGALIQRIGANAVRMYIIVGVKYINQDIMCTLAYALDFDVWPPVTKYNDRKVLQFDLRYAFNYDRVVEGKSKGSIEDLGSVVNEIIFGIFLITQPRVYSDEHIKWKSSHKRARAARNKPPLLEYRKLRLHICKPRKHYEHRPNINRVSSDTESIESVQHRRYHKVMGHFRHYINHEPPHTVWIEPHYRGDPALGVTFTERDVSR